MRAAENSVSAKGTEKEIFKKSVSKATDWEVWHQGRQTDQKYVGKMDGAQGVGLQHNYIQ